MFAGYNTCKFRSEPLKSSVAKTMATGTPVSPDWTTCAICLEVLDNRKSLPCLHSFCLECLEQYFEDNSPGDEVPCPLCRMKFHIPSDGLVSLRRQNSTQQTVNRDYTHTSKSKSNAESPRDVACEVCSEENIEHDGDIPTATMYCVDCSQKLCEQCSRPHRKWKVTGHQMRPLGAEMEQELMQLRPSSCEKHKHDQVYLIDFIRSPKHTIVFMPPSVMGTS